MNCIYSASRFFERKGNINSKITLNSKKVALWRKRNSSVKKKSRTWHSSYPMMCSRARKGDEFRKREVKPKNRVWHDIDLVGFSECVLNAQKNGVSRECLHIPIVYLNNRRIVGVFKA